MSDKVTCPACGLPALKQKLHGWVCGSCQHYEPHYAVRGPLPGEVVAGDPEWENAEAIDAAFGIKRK